MSIIQPFDVCYISYNVNYLKVICHANGIKTGAGTASSGDEEYTITFLEGSTDRTSDVLDVNTVQFQTSNSQDYTCTIPLDLTGISGSCTLQVQVESNPPNPADAVLSDIVSVTFTVEDSSNNY